MKKLVIIPVLLLFVTLVSGQEKEEKIDASKPTNFYSLLDNTIEYQKTPGANIFGYRGKFTFALNSENLLLAEIPLLYNDQSRKFGLGDIRARYFYLPYKNYNKFFGAFGPSIDVFAPTGSFEYGLGSGSWVISPGILAGLMASERLQFFPILSYQYISKNTTDLVPEDQKKEKHGMTFQVLTVIVLSDKLFTQVTPIFQKNNLSDASEDRFVQQVTAAYSLAEKLQLSAFFSSNFRDKIFTYQIGLTIFL